MARPPSMTLEQFDPALADLLVDQTQRTVGKSSTKKLLWRCPAHLNDPRHIYPSQVGNKTASNDPMRCNICIGKHVVPGINDVATTAPQAASLLVDQGLANSLTAASNKRVTFSCPDPDHGEWVAPMSNVAVQGTGCPQCSGRTAVAGTDDLATTHPRLAAQLADQTLATVLKAGSNRRVLWRCSDPTHEPWWTAVVHRTLRDTGCPQCSGRTVAVGQTDLATTHPQLAAQLADQTLATRISRSHDQKVRWICPNDPTHTWWALPGNRTRGAGCPVCANRVVAPGFNDIATTAPHLVDLLTDPQDAHRYTLGTATKLSWRCERDPAHTWLAHPGRFLSPRPPGCPTCFRAGRSAPEVQLAQLVERLLPGEQVLTGQRTILPGSLELDIVVPTRKIAIEFNGTYWHSQAHLTNEDYHARKSRLAAEAGYRLLHVWEDDWVDRQEIVVRGLAHRLGVSDRLTEVLPEVDPLVAQRLGARSLTPTGATGSETTAFWRANHLQGPVGSQHYVALRDDVGRIRALLGAGPRNHGSRTPVATGTWDVQRYATCGTVPGGFTRLLARATQELRAAGHQVSTWTSFSNDDLSEGGMYQAAGFQVDRRQPPSYSYVGDLTGWRRTHRLNFTRQRFATDDTLVYQEGWTERQAAEANGLHRVYDAGKTRWVKHV